MLVSGLTIAFIVIYSCIWFSWSFVEKLLDNRKTDAIVEVEDKEDLSSRLYGRTFTIKIKEEGA